MSTALYRPHVTLWVIPHSNYSWNRRKKKTAARAREPGNGAARRCASANQIESGSHSWQRKQRKACFPFKAARSSRKIWKKFPSVRTARVHGQHFSSALHGKLKSRCLFWKLVTASRHVAVFLCWCWGTLCFWELCQWRHGFNLWVFSKLST